jgi:hypothetical protein
MRNKKAAGVARGGLFVRCSVFRRLVQGGHPVPTERSPNGMRLVGTVRD